MPRHSPGDRRGACCGRADGGVRPAGAAREEAQGEREALSRPSTEEPPCGSQNCCHGSAVRTAGARSARRTGGARDLGVARRGRDQRPSALDVRGGNSHFSGKMENKSISLSI